MFGFASKSFCSDTKKLSPEQAIALPNQLKAVIGGTTNSTRNNYVSEQKDLLAILH